MPIRELRPTAPASPGLRAGRGGWQNRVNICLRLTPCHTSRCRRQWKYLSLGLPGRMTVSAQFGRALADAHKIRAGERRVSQREDRCALPETDCPGETRPLQIEPAMKRPIANMAAAITSISVTRVLPFIVWRLLCGR